jgi:restriction system protein
MLPLLTESADGEVKTAEVIDRLAEKLGLSAEERQELLTGGRHTVFANRVYWAKIYLEKARLMETSRRGHFRITDRGRSVLAQGPAKIDMAFLKQFPDFVEFLSRRRAAAAEPSPETPDATQEDSSSTPDEVLRAAHQRIEAALKQELLERILASPPALFESLVVQLLVAMGYGGTALAPGRVLGRSGDGGVDGVIDQDALGLDRVYVQAKRYAPGNNLSASAIRDFFGSLDRFKAAKGVLVTTSGFTTDALDTADFLSKRIVLIDGDRLAALMIRYDVGCRVEDTLYIKKADEDFFLE